MTDPHHSRLSRQLADLGIRADEALDPERLARLLEEIDSTYASFDEMGDTLMTVLDTLEGTNCHVDQHGELRGINDRADAYFGLHAATLIGTRFLEQVRIEDDRGVRLTEADLRRDRRIPRGRVYRVDGSSFSASISISTIGPDRREQGAVVLLLDVDDRVAEEQALHEARVEALVARRAERDKSLFLANMSHELRTPLNAIIGYSELLLETAHTSGDTAGATDLTNVVEAGRHLTELIGGILDLSKIEAGRMELSLEEHDVVTVVADALETFRLQIERKGLTLSLVAPDSLVLTTDRTRLRQILYNLLSNARKFTEEGAITVSVRGTEGGADIEVADTGIGISAEALPRIFDEFAQADALTSREFGGTGLGLSLSRRLCELLGGELTATSEPGVGSRFLVMLRADPQ